MFLLSAKAKLLAVVMLAMVALARAQSAHEPPAPVSLGLAREAARRGEELRRRWELDSAEAAFRQAASVDPLNLEAALGLARIAQARLDYVGAKRTLDRVRERHNDSSELLAAYGSLYLAVEDADRALEFISEALRIDPSSTEALLSRSGVDILRRDFKSAEARLRQLINRNPNISRARSMLGRALLEENRNRDAAVETERAIRLDAFDTDAIHTLAFVRATEGRADEVRALARRALALDSMNVGARRLLSQYVNGRAGYDQKLTERTRQRFERAVALKRAGKFKEAADALEATLIDEPRCYRALIALGDLLLREANYARAAEVARRAIEADPDGSLAHLELSYALWGMQERARSEIGATDFAALFYDRPDPPIFDLTKEVFPDYSSLTRRQQAVIDSAVAPLSTYLPALARLGARHYLIGFDQRISDLDGFDDVVKERTLDGRFFESLRGVGGRLTVSGIEHIDMAARGGFHAIAHEFAHQVHMTAMSGEEVSAIHKLYQRARSEDRALDYYAASNEYEYFAQGYEAFISERKRPSAGVTARHTRSELMSRDPELYSFLVRITGNRSE